MQNNRDDEESAPFNDKKPAASNFTTKWANERLEELLGYGWFQKFQIFVFLGAVSFVGPMNMFQLVFMVTKKSHRCALPGELETRYGDWNHSSLEQYTKECTTFTYKESVCKTGDNLTTCFDFLEEVPCSSYVHDMSGSDSFWSLSSEYDWVCDKAEYGSNVLMAQNVGIIISTLIFMQLSDKWGRRPVFHLTNIIYIVMRIISLYITHNYWAYMIVIAIGSTFCPLGVRIGYTVVAEMTNEQGRLWVYIVGWVMWVAGVAFLPVIAWLSQDWYLYGLIIPLCNLVFIPFIWLSPESPRLMLTQGKVDRGEKIISNIRKINGHKDNKEELRSELEAISEKISDEKVFGMVTLFKSRRLALYTVLLSIIWVVNDFFYIGGQLNVENLAGNQYINFALVGLTELPSVFIGEFLINRVGRRWSQVGCMAITAIIYAVITGLVSNDVSGTAITVMAITAKTASNVGWFIMWVQCVELYPTSVRVTGSNLCALVANIVCSAAPYVIYLGDTNLPAMYSIFMIMGLIGALAASFVPETFKQPFPECIEDIEERKISPYFSWRVWQKD